MTTVRLVYKFFDKVEDRIRFYLSHHPFLYSLIGVMGMVFIWKGVWETAEQFSILHGPVSILIGVLILLVTGLLVSLLIGDNIIMAGIRGEKKLVEKTSAEIEAEKNISNNILTKLEHIEKEVAAIKEQGA